ncbi:MAG: type VI secretion system baseplate subunit TssF [Proteobacteria bacterium]|nr:type VI secretion system baseplate subunit TssF [Pseudomonadota bacterium]
MDPRLLSHYDEELKFLREMGAEFAREFPKVAGRLGLDGVEANECADPYVERLLEGCAFLTARVQLQLKLEQPRFTEQLLRAIYPTLMAPTPSTAIVEIRPNAADATLIGGARIARGSALRSVLGKDEVTSCEYRTAHEVTLWPLRIAEAKYYGTSAGLGLTGVRAIGSARAGLRLNFSVSAGAKSGQLPVERLDLYLSGVEQLPRQIYEHIFTHALGFVVRARDGSHETVLPASAIKALGFSDSEALLPVSRRAFSGYRLLQEYFTLPERFLFVGLEGLKPALAAINAAEFEIVVLFDRPFPALEAQISAENFRLGCTPVINLFQRRADRIHLTDRTSEYHLVVDRTRPMDFEVIDVVSADAYGTRADVEVKFQPFYGTTEATWHAKERAYYTLRREPRLLSPRQRRYGPRTSYIGSEVYIALTDANAAPFRTDLRQLECFVTCTNRDLPLQMAVGRGRSDFVLEGGMAVESIKVIGIPTKPRPSVSLEESSWRLISHLSLNYASLMDASAEEGATALREILSLYGNVNDPAQQRQIEGVRSIATRPVVARLPGAGPVGIGRGIEVVLTTEDRSFEGTGAFLLGAVLEEFFARYVSINSFTQMVLRSAERGEVKRWLPRTGRRPAL